MGGLFFLNQVIQGVGEPELGVGIASFGSQPGASDQGVVRPVDERHGVQEEEFFGHKG
jgi:hypothetical protein